MQISSNFIATKTGFLQEVTISSFLSETNLESLFQHQDGIKKKPREKEPFKKR